MTHTLSTLQINISSEAAQTTWMCPCNQLCCYVLESQRDFWCIYKFVFGYQAFLHCCVIKKTNKYIKVWHLSSCIVTLPTWSCTKSPVSDIHGFKHKIPVEPVPASDTVSWERLDNRFMSFHDTVKLKAHTTMYNLPFYFLNCFLVQTCMANDTNTTPSHCVASNGGERWRGLMELEAETGLPLQRCRVTFCPFKETKQNLLNMPFWLREMSF